MIEAFTKKSNPFFGSYVNYTLSSMIFCVLLYFDRKNFSPGYLFGGEAYAMDGTLQSFILIQIPVIMNILLIDQTMNRFSAGHIVVRYLHRRKWLCTFLCLLVVNSIIIYSIQYGFLALASLIFYGTLAKWDSLVIPTLICNIVGLTVCYSYLVITESIISKASCYFLFFTLLLLVPIQTGDSAGCLWQLMFPFSQFRLYLLHGKLEIISIMLVAAIHVILAICILNAHFLKKDFVN